MHKVGVHGVARVRKQTAPVPEWSQSTRAATARAIKIQQQQLPTQLKPSINRTYIVSMKSDNETPSYLPDVLVNRPFPIIV